MSKRIVILNGSPRKAGNTSELVRAFTDGAKQAGNDVTIFQLDSMDIHGCKGCFGQHLIGCSLWKKAMAICSVVMAVHPPC